MTTSTRPYSYFLARRFELSAREAKKLDCMPERDELLAALEVLRHRDGQCLPPSCPLVSGALRDALSDPDYLCKFLRENPDRSDLSLDQVTDWTWVSVPTHRGKVPHMSRNERSAWNKLSNADKLARGERALLKALTRKLAYRAAREIDAHQYA